MKTSKQLIEEMIKKFERHIESNNIVIKQTRESIERYEEEIRGYNIQKDLLTTELAKLD